MRRVLLTATCLALVLAAAPPAVRAHEIPADVVVRLFVHPEGGRLQVLVRVPMEAMRDFDFPVRGPGYLDVAAAEPLVDAAARTWIADALWFYEEGRTLPRPRLLAARVSLPSDDAFRGYATALAHLRAPPLTADAEVVPQQALLDAWLEVPIASPAARLSLESDLARLGLHTTTVLRFLPADGAERAFQYTGDPGRIRLDPRWHQAAWRFVRLGFGHILGGLDHLLFLVCLVIPFRRLRPLVAVVTAFTVAHSVTLLASAAGMAPQALWFPALVETLIAASIVIMALENIVGPRLDRRWHIAFAFGLIHGFGFSFALRRTLQFAGSHLLSSLLAFNLGVEAGQLLVVAVAVPTLGWLFRHVVAERMGTILLSAIVAHSAWHWMSDRAADLLAYRFTAPALDGLLVAGLLRWTALGVTVAGALWALSELIRRLRPEAPGEGLLRWRTDGSGDRAEPRRSGP